MFESNLEILQSGLPKKTNVYVSGSTINIDGFDCQYFIFDKVMDNGRNYVAYVAARISDTEISNITILGIGRDQNFAKYVDKLLRTAVIPGDKIEISSTAGEWVNERYSYSFTVTNTSSEVISNFGIDYIEFLDASDTQVGLASFSSISKVDDKSTPIIIQSEEIPSSTSNGALIPPNGSRSFTFDCGANKALEGCTVVFKGLKWTNGDGTLGSIDSCNG